MIPTEPRLATELAADDGDLIDAETIRQTSETALWAPVGSTPGQEQDALLKRLEGHTHLLLPEVADRLPRLQGQWPDVAKHVITRAQRALGAPAPSLQDKTARVMDLAVYSRALLHLYRVAEEQS
ncbi:DUF6415 family natural product biosynthesis protein [Streptomyces mirabilis]|uniref:DUF6415 family natural product biosynthesis protein n=1 Tax=Streptomyces mirabilis TaxID=68239 RepID=UPI0033F5149F